MRMEVAMPRRGPGGPGQCRGGLGRREGHHRRRGRSVREPVVSGVEKRVSATRAGLRPIPSFS